MHILDIMCLPFIYHFQRLNLKSFNSANIPFFGGVKIYSFTYSVIGFRDREVDRDLLQLRDVLHVIQFVMTRLHMGRESLVGKAEFTRDMCGILTA